MRFAGLLIAVSCCSCLGPLVAVGIGTERGRADVRRMVDEDGVVYLERDPHDAVGTVVMVHGYGGNKDHWTRMIAQMPDRLRILAPDLPGFGESEFDPSERYDLETQAKRLHRFVKRRGIERAHFFGNSMGGEVVVLHALAHPEHVESLVLFDPRGIKEPVESDRTRLEREGKSPMVVRTREDLQSLIDLSFVKKPKAPEPVLEYMAEVARNRADVAAKVRKDIDTYPARTGDRLASLARPVLVVWGDSDRIIHPSTAALWGERLPDNDVVMMKDTGHGPMIERPAECAALVAVWWQRRGFFVGRPRRGASPRPTGRGGKTPRAARAGCSSTTSRARRRRQCR